MEFFLTFNWGVFFYFLGTISSAVLYVNIGYMLGHLSFHLYKDLVIEKDYGYKYSKGVQYIFFPVTTNIFDRYFRCRIEQDNLTPTTLVRKFDETAYKLIITFAWPLKVGFNAIILFFLGLSRLLIFLKNFIPEFIKIIVRLIIAAILILPFWLIKYGTLYLRRKLNIVNGIDNIYIELFFYKDYLWDMVKNRSLPKSIYKYSWSHSVLYNIIGK